MEAAKQSMEMASTLSYSEQTEEDHRTETLYILQIFTEIFKRDEDKSQSHSRNAFSKDSTPDRAVQQHKQIQFALKSSQPVFLPE